MLQVDREISLGSPASARSKSSVSTNLVQTEAVTAQAGRASIHQESNYDEEGSATGRESGGVTGQLLRCGLKG